MTGQRWYVVQTQPQCEQRAEINLRRQGFTIYLPRYLRSRRHARRTEVVARPLFPRYLFVGLDMARDRWRTIQSTFGVSQMVLAGDSPVAVPDEVIAEIRARENEDGYVKLGLPPGVGPGSAIRLIEGIFADSRGVIDRIADDRRVAVLLKLLGREVRVFVPAANIGTV
ncbi:MAG: transcription termination/antitermination protein NusG [Pseudorhodoplanes sp.]